MSTAGVASPERSTGVGSGQRTPGAIAARTPQADGPPVGAYSVTGLYHAPRLLAADDQIEHRLFRNLG